MDGGISEEIIELAQQAVAGVTSSSNNWAAIIMLVGLLGFLGIAWMVARASMKDRSARFLAREAQTRADMLKREADMKQSFEAQLEHERVTQDFIARMNDRYDATLNKVTEAFGESSAVMRQAKDEIRRAAASFDRNTAVLEKFVPRLPKTNSGRKPQVDDGE